MAENRYVSDLYNLNERLLKVVNRLSDKMDAGIEINDDFLDKIEYLADSIGKRVNKLRDLRIERSE